MCECVRSVFDVFTGWVGLLAPKKQEVLFNVLIN